MNAFWSCESCELNRRCVLAADAIWESICSCSAFMLPHSDLHMLRPRGELSKAR